MSILPQSGISIAESKPPASLLALLRSMARTVAVFPAGRSVFPDRRAPIILLHFWGVTSRIYRMAIYSRNPPSGGMLSFPVDFRSNSNCGVLGGPA